MSGRAEDEASRFGSRLLSLLSGLTIRQKLMAIVMSISVSTLLVACLLFVVFQYQMSKNRLVEDLRALTRIAGDQSSVSFDFGQPDDAKSILQSLRIKPSVLSACLYSPEGQLLTADSTDDGAAASACPGSLQRTPKGGGHFFASGALEIVQPIMRRGDDHLLGWIYVRSSVEELNEIVLRSSLAILFIGIALGAVAFALSARLQEVISGPLRRLATTASEVRENQDLTLRAVKRYDDEVGDLVDSFNAMLRQLQIRSQERRKAEAALRESEERFRQMAENIREVFWMTNADLSQVLYVSPAYEEIWGRSCQSWYDHPKSFLDAVHAEDSERIRSSFLDGVRESDFHNEFRIERPDGSVRWILDHSFPIRDSQGRVCRLAGIARDVTEVKRLEVQFRQAQKMEAIGRLAGGVAHDFNNLLMIIRGRCEMLLADLKGQDPLLKQVEEIHWASDRAASLTGQLLAFSRKQVMQPRILDLDGVVKGAEKMLRRLIGEDIDLRVEVHPDLGRIKADPGQVEQVLMNLAVNARDAMPEGGELTIHAGNVDYAESVDDGESASRPGDYVLISVRDQGIGMSDEVKARIFEPFFTTKEVGKGTGLGLATVYGIVKQSGGTISFESELSQGTTFHVFLPRVSQSEERDSSAVDSLHPTDSGWETVLLVEDEEGVRALTAQFLKLEGYKVLEAEDGGKALELSRRHAGDIHLLLTDMVMPGMSGPQLADRMLQSRPDVKILFVSGYTDDTIARNGGLEGAPFLQKPFSRGELVGKIRKVLDADAVPAGLRR